MEPDSSRQHILDMLEREEMASTTSSEPQLQSPQSSPNNLILQPRPSKPDKVSHPPPWEKDLQPEDHPCSPAKKILRPVYILEPHIFQNNDFIENIPGQNINKDKIKNLHPIVQPLFYSFEKQTNISDRAELFTKIIPYLTLDKESSIDIMPPDELMKSVLAYYLDEHQKEKKTSTKQYACAVAYLKNGDFIIFPAVYPDSEDKHSASVPKKHSEEKLITRIENFLQKNETKVIKLLVYSYNSPCLRRENNATCCMFLLLQKAAQWFNMYGFFTEVAFTKPWGLAGPNFFKALKGVSNLRSDFFPYIEKCKNICFKLNEKELRRNMLKNKNSGLYKKIQLATDKQKLSSTITSTCDKLVKQANTSCHKIDHLDSGTRIISLSEYPLEVKEEIITAQIKMWKEFINDESMSPIREKITTDFNNAVVQFFVKELKFFLGNSSPLRLYQVSQNMEGEGEYVQQIRELFNPLSLRHSKRVAVSIPGGGTLLCGVCMFSPCQCEFSPASSHSPKTCRLLGDSKLSVSVTAAESPF